MSYVELFTNLNSKFERGNNREHYRRESQKDISGR